MHNGSHAASIFDAEDPKTRSDSKGNKHLSATGKSRNAGNVSQLRPPPPFPAALSRKTLELVRTVNKISTTLQDFVSNTPGTTTPSEEQSSSQTQSSNLRSDSEPRGDRSMLNFGDESRRSVENSSSIFNCKGPHFPGYVSAERLLPAEKRTSNIKTTRRTTNRRSRAPNTAGPTVVKKVQSGPSSKRLRTTTQELQPTTWVRPVEDDDVFDIKNVLKSMRGLKVKDEQMQTDDVDHADHFAQTDRAVLHSSHHAQTDGGPPPTCNHQIQTEEPLLHDHSAQTDRSVGPVLNELGSHCQGHTRLEAENRHLREQLKRLQQRSGKPNTSQTTCDGPNCICCRTRISQTSVNDMTGDTLAYTCGNSCCTCCCASPPPSSSYPTKERRARPQETIDNFENSVLLQKLQTMSAENNALQMRLSRHSVEMKSLLDQNDLLRRENKRLIDQDLSLKQRLMELQNRHNSGEEYSTLHLGTVDEERIKTLVRQIDAEAERIRFKKYELASSGSVSFSLTATSPQSPLTHIDQILNSLDTLRLSVLSVRLTPDRPKHLDMCADLLQVVSGSANAFLTSLMESAMLEEHVQRLRDSTAAIREEAERTVKEITSKFQEEVGDLEKENGALTADLETARTGLEKIKSALDEEKERRQQELDATLDRHSRELQTLKDQHMDERSEWSRRAAAADAALEELRRQQEELLRRHKNEKPKGPVVDDVGHLTAERTATALLQGDMRGVAYLREIGELKAENQRLQSQQESLERSLAEYKTQAADLQEIIRHLRDQPDESQISMVRYLRKIERLEKTVEEEQMKGVKAAEIIETLKVELHDMQTELARHDGKNSVVEQTSNVLRELGRSLFEKINTLKEADERTSAALESHDFEALTGLLKENQDTSEQLTQLTSMVEGVLEHLNILKDENSILKSNLAKVKEKLRQREATWLQKFQGLQGDLDDIQNKQHDMDVLLAEYESQYREVLALAATSAAFDNGASSLNPLPFADHPLPFLTHFTHLHNLHAADMHSMSILQQRAAEYTKLADERYAELQAMEARQASGREKVSCLERTRENLSQRLEDIQKEVSTLREQKKLMEGKMKRIVAGYKKMILGGTGSPTAFSLDS
ncbi:hypothetical protein BC832DRAFT_592431 [Gaertneriomyces semiglobifer]|nr:hypothetical protein BC832DRAFT_592431 [Gaertneriomyces semiglobifer]